MSCELVYVTGKAQRLPAKAKLRAGRKKLLVSEIMQVRFLNIVASDIQPRQRTNTLDGWHSSGKWQSLGVILCPLGQTLARGADSGYNKPQGLARAERSDAPKHQ